MRQAIDDISLCLDEIKSSFHKNAIKLNVTGFGKRLPIPIFMTDGWIKGLIHNRKLLVFIFCAFTLCSTS